MSFVTCWYSMQPLNPLHMGPMILQTGINTACALDVFLKCVILKCYLVFEMYQYHCFQCFNANLQRR